GGDTAGEGTVRRFLVILLASVSVAACVSAPPTTPSQVEIKSGSLGLSGTQTPAISDTWWTAFSDKQLDDLVAQALSGNPSLQVALARIRRSRATRRSSASISARATSFLRLTAAPRNGSAPHRPIFPGRSISGASSNRRWTRRAPKPKRRHLTRRLRGSPSRGR